jgi:hypothetical protein
MRRNFNGLCRRAILASPNASAYSLGNAKGFDPTP